MSYSILRFTKLECDGKSCDNNVVLSKDDPEADRKKALEGWHLGPFKDFCSDACRNRR